MIYAAALALQSDPHQVQRVRVNFTWLLNLRWAAAAGQLATILLVRLWFGVDLPLRELGAILAFQVVSNVGLTAWFRGALVRGDAPARIERVLGSILVMDIILLTLLLYLTGGRDNPFAVFYLVNLVLSAVVLPPRWTWLLTGLALLGYLVLLYHHRPLPELFRTGIGPGSADLTLQQKGIPVAFCAAVVVIAVFVTRVTAALAGVEAELREARQRQARSERLQALGTLAAGAAHELASPLSTIAVAAKDLEIAVKRLDSGEPAEDARLIRREVERCRAILDQMSADAGQSVGEEPEATSVDELFEAVLSPLKRRAGVRLEVEPACRARRITVHRRALSLALRQIVKNALDASPPGQEVRVRVTEDRRDLIVEVEDQGSGMTSETLARVTEPFFTTKEPGQGMGLGLFLTHTVVERMEGRLQFESQVGSGTRVRVALPLRRMQAEPPVTSPRPA